MTSTTKREAIGDFITQGRIGCIRLDVVRGQAAFMLSAFALTVLADVIIALQDGSSPRDIEWFFEALPCLSAFPLIVLLTFGKRPVFDLCLKNLGLRLGGKNASSGALADFGARDFRPLLAQHPLSLRSRPMCGCFSQAKMPRPFQDGHWRDAVTRGKAGVVGYRVSRNKCFIHRLQNIQGGATK